jgi:thiol:disulfide interchange protein DsbD
MAEKGISCILWRLREMHMPPFLEHTEELIRRSPFLAFAAVYAAGVLTSFTPCVYPVIPLTLGVIGARTVGSKFRGFSVSLVYVLGLAVAYAVLGALASLSGSLFGAVASSPWTYFLVANAYLLFGLSMTGGLSFPQIRLLPDRFHKKRDGFAGVFLMGALAGLVVGPCTAPVLAALLVYVGSRQNVAYGFLLLLAFGYGIGFLFIVLGTFTGLLASMPKSGAWLERTKVAFGWLLILAAEYLFVKMGGLLV